MTTTKEQHTITQALSSVMEEVRAVGKDGRNTQQNYSFRGIDGVVNAVGPALRKHGVVVLPTVEDITYRDVLVGKNATPMRECTVRITYTFYGPAGDFIGSTVCGEALDSGDKATAKAFSVAYRTCLLQALTIPTDEPDPDEASPERSHKKPAPQPEGSVAAPKPVTSPPAAPLNIVQLRMNWWSAAKAIGLEPADVEAYIKSKHGKAKSTDLTPDQFVDDIQLFDELKALGAQKVKAFKDSLTEKKAS